MKVKDIFKDKTFAVKVSSTIIISIKTAFYKNLKPIFYVTVLFVVQVLPKSEILKRGVVEQSKEEVIIQVLH